MTFSYSQLKSILVVGELGWEEEDLYCFYGSHSIYAAGIQKSGHLEGSNMQN